MTPEDIAAFHESGNLKALEQYYYRTYRGSTPDWDEYLQALDRYYSLLDAKEKKTSIVVDPSTGKYRASKSSVAHLLERYNKKMLIIDAIITLRKSLPRRNVVRADRFNIEQQLTEIN